MLFVYRSASVSWCNCVISIVTRQLHWKYCYICANTRSTSRRLHCRSITRRLLRRRVGHHYSKTAGHVCVLPGWWCAVSGRICASKQRANVTRWRTDAAPNVARRHPKRPRPAQLLGDRTPITCLDLSLIASKSTPGPPNRQALCMFRTKSHRRPFQLLPRQLVRSERLGQVNLNIMC